jgi:hypothetical protein
VNASNWRLIKVFKGVKNMESIHNAILGWLENEGISFAKADEGYAIHIPVNGKSGEWDFIF